jgi:GST-like protein
MTDLSAFAITRKWPAAHPGRLQLYSLPTPNGVKVSIALEETGLAYEPHLVRFDTNDQMSPEFLSLNPNNKIPAIIDPNGPGGQPLALFESGAILVYLAEKTGRLYGEDAAERSTVLQWLMLQMSSVGPLLGQATHFNRMAPKDEPYAFRRFITQSVRLCELYDARLGEARYLAGDNFSIADVATFAWLWRHPTMIGLDAAAYPNLQRWVAEVRERPGLKRVHGAYKELVRLDSADAAAADPAVIDRFLGRGGWFRLP